jgi:hypothetical protein
MVLGNMSAPRLTLALAHCHSPSPRWGWLAVCGSRSCSSRRVACTCGASTSGYGCASLTVRSAGSTARQWWTGRPSRSPACWWSVSGCGGSAVEATQRSAPRACSTRHCSWGSLASLQALAGARRERPLSRVLRVGRGGRCQAVCRVPVARAGSGQCAGFDRLPGHRGSPPGRGPVGPGANGERRRGGRPRVVAVERRLARSGCTIWFH